MGRSWFFVEWRVGRTRFFLPAHRGAEQFQARLDGDMLLEPGSWAQELHSEFFGLHFL